MSGQDFWSASHELIQNQIAFVVVTLVGVKGHAPQEIGAKAIFTAEGLHFGTVGGGKVEAKAASYANELLENLKTFQKQSPPDLLIWNLQKDVGMTCGGEVTFLFEVHTTKSLWKIVIFGAGHVAQALVRTLEPLQCQIDCVDPRPEWLERLPSAPKITKICLAEPKDYLKNLREKAYFIVITRGHASDMPILEVLFKNYSDAPYIGCMGSDVKALKIRKELAQAGISNEILARFHCPIGLPFGTNDPAEIAISIAAELLKERDRIESLKTG